mgnify:CR=1 FL=1
MAWAPQRVWTMAASPDRAARHQANANRSVQPDPNGARQRVSALSNTLDKDLYPRVMRALSQAVRSRVRRKPNS